MQKTDQPDCFYPLFNFWKNLVYHLLSCSNPDRVLSLLQEGFHFKLDRMSRTTHVHISKRGCFGTIFIYRCCHLGTVSAEPGGYGVTSWCDTSYREPTRDTVIPSESSCNPCLWARQGSFGTGSFQYTGRVSLPALSKKVKQKGREFMKGKPKKTYVAMHSKNMVVSRKCTRKEDPNDK